MPQQKISEQRIRKLVLRGGGTKGLEHLGTIKELERVGAWSDIREIWGSSAGGIAATLAGLGMSSIEIQQQMMEMNFTSFMDKDVPFWAETLGMQGEGILGKLESMIRVVQSTRHGLYKGDAFADYIKMIIAARTGDPNITFDELHKRATDPTSKWYDPMLKDIMLTGSKIGPPPTELRLFNWRDTPNMPVWKAVRITMSFPGAFEAVEDNGEIFVDGGLKDNLPIGPAIDFNSADDNYHLRTTPEKGVIAVSMENSATIDHLQGYKKEQHLRDVGVVDFAKQMATAPISNTELLRQHQDCIIMPDDLGQPTLNFTMSYDNKQKLLAEGHRAAQEKLMQRSDWAKTGEPPIYQVYHNDLDARYLIERWKEHKTLCAAKAAGASYDGLQERINQLEHLYASFFDIINHSTDLEHPDHVQIYNALMGSFTAREKDRQQAIQFADKRKKATQKAVDLIHAQERLNVVKDIITNYESQLQKYNVLMEHVQLISELSDIVQNTLRINNTPEIQEACTALNTGIQLLYTNKDHTNPSVFTNIISEFKTKLASLGLNQEQINNFVKILTIYSQYINANKHAVLPMAQQELPQYLATLQVQAADLQTQAALVSNSLRQLKIDCYRNGMQILHPEKTDEIIKEKPENCTMQHLQEEYDTAKATYETATRTGEMQDIAAATLPFHYQTVVKAKRAAHEAINNHTGITTKFADFLQAHCNLFYKGFHFLASLNPLSTYKLVVLIRNVKKQLTTLQQQLETQPNLGVQDPITRTYMEAINTISEGLHASKLSPNKQTTDYKKLTSLLTNFTKHQQQAAVSSRMRYHADDNPPPPEISSH